MLRVSNKNKILLSVALTLTMLLGAGNIQSVYGAAPGGGGGGEPDPEPECTCEVIIDKQEDYSTTIDSDGHEISDLSQYLSFKISNANCEKHSGSDIGTINYSVEYSIESESNGNGTISNKKLSIDNIDGTYEAIIKGKAISDGNTLVEGTINISVKYEAGKLEITNWNYNPSTQKLSVTVAPHGNKEADLYLDEDVKTHIKFNRVFFTYVPSTVTIDVADTVLPNTVKNVNIERSTTNPKQVIISWDDGGDNTNIKTLQAKNGNDASSTVNVDIKSSYTLKTIKLYNDSDQDGIILLNQENENSIIVNLSDIKWGAKIEIQSFDLALNSSGSVAMSIPNTVIYNPTIVNDTASVSEGSSVIVLAKENDIHDPGYDTPKLAYVEITSGEGDAQLIDVLQLADVPSDAEGLIVVYMTKDGVSYDEPVKIRYVYSQVREDIPAAEGTITINVSARNQEPVAVDDGATITNSLNAASGREIIIPWSMILANDTDRETGTTPEESVANLQVTQVRNVSTGTIELLASNKTIRIVPSNTFYGLLTFEYKISDGELTSLNWATVTISVTKQPAGPTAKDVSTVMELTETSKAVSLDVQSSGVPYTITNISNIKVNGVAATSAYGITLTTAESEDNSGNKIPYVRLTLSNTSTLKDKDKITFTYTVDNGYGTATANITVEMTSGDDPYDMEGYLYVHRRPIAAFTPLVTVENGYVTSAILTSEYETSYDLDHQYMHDKNLPRASVAGSNASATRPDYSWNGLRAWEWGIKTITGDWTTAWFDAEGKSSDTSGANKEPNTSQNSSTDGSYNYGSADAARAAGLQWIQNQINTLIASQQANKSSESIIISLRVRDIDNDDTVGVWSEQRTILLTPLPLPPVAQFNLDNSTYTVSKTEDFNIQVTDLSYDPNGDDILEWQWELTDSSGKTIWKQTITNGTSESLDKDYVSKMISENIKKIVTATGYNPDSPEFKLSLVVVEDTKDKLESDKYSVTFKVYRGNDAPIINDDNTNMTLTGSTVYEIDNGADGTVGDNWGTEGNTTHPGTINFAGMFTVTDDQPLSQLRINWLFEGESVEKRKDWSEDRRIVAQKAYSNLTYSPFQAPFVNTVTAQGFEPGAYRISVSVKDNPQGEEYAAGSAKTSYWTTYGEPPEAPPYHLYVVPKLDIYAEIHFNGYVIGLTEDTTYRISDGKTLRELGLELEDVVPTIGDTFEVSVVTNKYVTYLHGYEDYNTNEKQDSSEKTFEMTRESVNLDGTINWIGKFTLDDVDDAPEGELLTKLNLRLFGETIWGSETGDVTRTKDVPIPLMVLPVKLYDFRVTEITDPNLSNIFSGYIESLKAKGDKLDNGSLTDGVLVGRLAVDRNSKATDTTINPMSKGYSFYFKLSSKGLTKDEDQIRIYPRLFAVSTDSSGNLVVGKELVGYVPNRVGKYEVYTTFDASTEILEDYGLYYTGTKQNDIGDHFQIIIGTDLRETNGSEQTWYGRYGVPADARFFYADDVDSLGKIDSSIEWKGDVLVAFDIQAFKNGRSRYDYVERGQWQKEREYIVDSLKTGYVTQETKWLNSKNYLGTVAIFDAGKSIKDNYTSNPIWKD